MSSFNYWISEFSSPDSFSKYTKSQIITGDIALWSTNIVHSKHVRCTQCVNLWYRMYTLLKLKYCRQFSQWINYATGANKFLNISHKYNQWIQEKTDRPKLSLCRGIILKCGIKMNGKPLSHCNYTLFVLPNVSTRIDIFWLAWMFYRLLMDRSGTTLKSLKRRMLTTHFF